jgi:hypothetical protein
MLGGYREGSACVGVDKEHPMTWLLLALLLLVCQLAIAAEVRNYRNRKHTRDALAFYDRGGTR